MLRTTGYSGFRRRVEAVFVTHTKFIHSSFFILFFIRVDDVSLIFGGGEKEKKEKGSRRSSRISIYVSTYYVPKRYGMLTISTTSK